MRYSREMDFKKRSNGAWSLWSGFSVVDTIIIHIGFYKSVFPKLGSVRQVPGCNVDLYKHLENSMFYAIIRDRKKNCSVKHYLILLIYHGLMISTNNNNNKQSLNHAYLKQQIKRKMYVTHCEKCVHFIFFWEIGKDRHYCISVVEHFCLAREPLASHRIIVWEPRS
jgi:hypothetical protein